MYQPFLKRQGSPDVLRMVERERCGYGDLVVVEHLPSNFSSVVEHLPNKHKVLGLVPNSSKKDPSPLFFSIVDKIYIQRNNTSKLETEKCTRQIVTKSW